MLGISCDRQDSKEAEECTLQEHSTGQSTATATPTAEPVLDLQEIRKSYGKTQALISLDLRLRPGAVHGLVGENGAGKSTLVKILSGATAPDGGSIALNGESVALTSPDVARKLGISTVFQELTLIPDLTVAENLLMQGGGDWVQSRSERIRRGSEMARRWGVTSLDMGAKISALSLRDRQLIEILCAVDRPHNVLILDEPTSSLLPADTKWLLTVVRYLVARGSAVVFISHMLDEVEEFCDEVSVQRNGTIVANHDSTPLDRELVVKQMIGRSLDAAFPEKSPSDPKAVSALSVRDLRFPDRCMESALMWRGARLLGWQPSMVRVRRSCSRPLRVMSAPAAELLNSSASRSSLVALGGRFGRVVTRAASPLSRPTGNWPAPSWISRSGKTSRSRS